MQKSNEFQLHPRLRQAADEFGVWVRAMMDRHMPPNPEPTSIFHYTRAATSSVIISSGTFRFTEYKALDDEREIQLGLGMARDLLLWRVENDPDLNQIFAHIFWEKMISQMDEAFHFLVFSSALKPDNTCLWHLYGEQDRGVAFEIDVNALDLQGAYDDAHVWGATRFPIRYGASTLREYQQEITEELADTLDVGRVRYGEENMRAFHKRLFVDYGLGVLFNSMLFKSLDWAEQDEYRYLIMGSKQLLEMHPGACWGPKYKGKNGFHIDIPLIGAAPIPSIRMGSESDQGLPDMLRKAVAEKGWSTQI